MLELGVSTQGFIWDPIFFDPLSSSFPSQGTSLLLEFIYTLQEAAECISASGHL